MSRVIVDILMREAVDKEESGSGGLAHATVAPNHIGSIPTNINILGFSGEDMQVLSLTKHFR